MLLFINVDFPITPINPLFTPNYLRPNSSDLRPLFSVRLGGGRVGVVTTTPLRNSASAIVPVMSSSTNVNDSSDIPSYTAPVGLSIRVLPVAIPFIPVPLSLVGSPIAAPVKKFLS